MSLLFEVFTLLANALIIRGIYANVLIIQGIYPATRV